MANTRNLHIDQGSDYVVVLDSGLDLTSFTARAHFRANPFSETPIFETDTDGSLSLADTGEITLSVPAATSAAWTVDRMVYDIEVLDAQQNPTRVFQGAVYVSREVTRG